MSSQVKRGGKGWKAGVGVISTVIIVGLFVALLGLMQKIEEFLLIIHEIGAA